MQAYIVDEVEESVHHYPGSSEVTKVVNVHVTDAPTKADALREAHWRASQDGFGGTPINGPFVIGVQGPDDGFDPQTWLVSERVTYIEER